MGTGQGPGQFQRTCEGGAFGWVLMVLFVAMGGGAVWFLFGPRWQARAPLEAPSHMDSRAPSEELRVWFAAMREDTLVPEKRLVTPNATQIERAKAALGELIVGPKTEALRTLPADVKVRELFIDDQGTVYVDFTDGLSRNHPGGPWSEVLTIRSIVQTLTSNVPEIKRVQILIEGRETDSLAGHVDIRGPIAPTWVTSPR